MVFGNSIFYYSYFSFSLIQAKVDAAIALADQGQEKGLIKVATTNLQKDESDEVWYQHKLYDVLKRETFEDQEYVYLLQDKDEQQVLEQNDDYIGKEFSFLLKSNSSLRTRHKQQSIVDLHYIVPNFKNTDDIGVGNKDLFLRSASDTFSMFVEISAPPPRFSHC